MYFNASWMMRGPPVSFEVREDVTRPNVGPVRFPLGLFRFTQLPMLNASSLTWTLEGRAVTPGSSKFLNSEKSKFLNPGPRKALRGSVPNVPGAGSVKSVAVNTPVSHFCRSGLPRLVPKLARLTRSLVAPSALKSQRGYASVHVTVNGAPDWRIAMPF